MVGLFFSERDADRWMLAHCAKEEVSPDTYGVTPVLLVEDSTLHADSYMITTHDELVKAAGLPYGT